jgi:hypothetical protein
VVLQEPSRRVLAEQAGVPEIPAKHLYTTVTSLSLYRDLGFAGPNSGGHEPGSKAVPTKIFRIKSNTFDVLLDYVGHGCTGEPST